MTVLAVLLFVSQIKLWFGDYGVVRLSSLKNELEQQVIENNRLIKRNETLNAQVEELREGKEALEERARSQLGMIKDGEVFIQEMQSEQSPEAQKP
ncbi:MAG: septum formation initiator family protein [Arenicella sp.]